MAWFFRVIEHEDGGWACRWGLHVFDIHDELHDAVRHCSELAGQHRPSQLILHPRDGTARLLESFD
jgi:hypothetical protein